jgi:UDP-N-acetylmuramate dehydrogenase
MLRDVALERFNTLRLPSTAQFLAMPRTFTDARSAIESAVTRGLPVTVLGAGSNVVLRSRVHGCVIMPRLDGVRLDWSDRKALVTAGAGVTWHDLVRFCLGQGLTGVENLALIPGRVGAAPIQNIGAYGVEFERCFQKLTALSCRDAGVLEMDARQCAFGYRDSVFKHALKGSCLITSVTLSLDTNAAPRTDYPDLQREIASMGVRANPVVVAEAVTRIRRRKLPDVRKVPNAGSFFKNPVLTDIDVDRLRSRLDRVPTYSDPNGTKVAAARLIEAAGWKTRTLGAAGVWYRQPLVLINRGGATGAAMLRLGRAIQTDVAEKFGVQLELEPVVLGSDE